MEELTLAQAQKFLGPPPRQIKPRHSLLTIAVTAGGLLLLAVVAIRLAKYLPWEKIHLKPWNGPGEYAAALFIAFIILLGVWLLKETFSTGQKLGERRAYLMHYGVLANAKVIEVLPDGEPLDEIEVEWNGAGETHRAKVKTEDFSYTTGKEIVILFSANNAGNAIHLTRKLLDQWNVKVSAAGG